MKPPHIAASRDPAYSVEMSNNDLWIRDILANYGVIAMVILCIVIWIVREFPKLRRNTYKAHLLGFEMECAELASPYKEHLFKVLQYIVSNDEILRSMGSIRVLEIGVKTGVNRTCIRYPFAILHTTQFYTLQKLRFMFNNFLIISSSFRINVQSLRSSD